MEQRVLEKDDVGMDSIIIKVIYCLCLHLHNLFPSVHKKASLLASSFSLRETSEAWGLGLAFPRSMVASQHLVSRYRRLMATGGLHEP